MRTITPELLVDDVMRQWLETIQVFLDHKFLCVGCPIGCFHSIAEACRVHQFDLVSFVTLLQAAARVPSTEQDAR
jgi:hybrid cluster-associated redox disulfide protein